ncbi:hypothetical protein ACXR0M_15135 [Pseudomonas sp. Eth.TT006]
MTNLTGQLRKNERHLFLFFLISLTILLYFYRVESESTVPDDISTYVEKRSNCDSLRGEITEPDPKTPKSLDHVVSDINKYCKGTDLQLKQLKEKYYGDVEIIKKLSEFEENVEADMSF